MEPPPPRSSPVGTQNSGYDNELRLRSNRLNQTLVAELAIYLHDPARMSTLFTNTLRCSAIG